MDIQQTEFPGLVIITPRVFSDDRGFFKETFQQERYEQAGIPGPFVQDNHSRSSAGILRGLHFQIHRPQAKLVFAVEGEILDVCVDLRKNSPTFGKSISVLLSAENHKQLFVPAGFAHGFYVLSPRADFMYKCTDYYFPEHERTLLWNDPALEIEWPLSDEPILSEKDRKGLPLSECEIFESL
ncbi:dTDP-4-dehydrorhamnose 3,5-epimerase [Gimesia maris]|jgi:dTDP-4-dehydrorhamnose 3,5-epimerase|uniref:dTDP-4-dehydrorhamnose 3,5-epimerase n=1 Tax=Gimesia maris TaxID=122 RepID=A0ABX5YQ72_9PLAN|nr:dTDP-4-dehydrorhamnose 3,5-epimerase [Gimesia maris]EDL60410.1 dTDP-4-keto-6-deoxy-D-glucose-3,5-epimerase [Gimesia maris DSM 8797]QDT80141.1 dTDP-4-dehydrorhamnose 3,5-epimerase [Gimesia maris]QEG17826.1 dTDP-4-dehydrorhamnose 3,5-epimerase [Gimesia maris]QGQ29137.1 dTDP-4-dehydrorhamnose 3,5-epimerase [Gimesia maris]|tara:strand:- start:40487 stop:41035 length:549 start_codon:yes stop_codon:yes gene_type:complete